MPTTAAESDSTTVFSSFRPHAMRRAVCVAVISAVRISGRHCWLCEEGDGRDSVLLRIFRWPVSVCFFPAFSIKDFAVSIKPDKPEGSHECASRPACPFCEWAFADLILGWDEMEVR
ncbi:hypothetical protein Nepgr_022488 [Nepenthes gracilis]|uniref:Uncharacterized protein n=1 Tax=Nepenthes gracilis TaxID=150966 RepID=A0AAD3T121_NEPGR|nr:hypothetical protein Nepgr_022488 [Nepenthes gracilis]